MLAKRHITDSSDHGIDLAPMLDFTINLLIFFIITTSFIKEPGITVVKPEAATALNNPQGNLLIAVRESGEIWMDRREVELRDVRLLIERFHIERPDDAVVIIADAQSEAGVVADVMDEVRAGGISDVSIAADEAGGGG
jgi:biopolymer transport protein ExbD